MNFIDFYGRDGAMHRYLDIGYWLAIGILQRSPIGFTIVSGEIFGLRKTGFKGHLHSK